MSSLQETVLQFGTGKFLRAFADLFIDQANKAGQHVGCVAVVQSTGDSRAKLINRQGGRYHVLIRGLADGRLIDEVEEVECISRALTAAGQWPEVLALARSPHLRTIISNTAEIGYTLDPADQPDSKPPRSWPAKLLLILHERFQSGQAGVTILPCELFEQNADLLQRLLLQLAEAWQFPKALGHWLQSACEWRNTLVDRIVAGKPPAHPQFEEDALLTVAEPSAFWAIEGKAGSTGLFQHPALHFAENIQPFFLRKVRILNAAHTALLSQALPRGFKTVREAVLDGDIGAWLNRLLFDEIVPVLEGRVNAPDVFARQTLERFCNPFLEHKLSDIAAYHVEKVKIRLLPTRDEYVARFGRSAPLLEEAIAWSDPTVARD